jgi:hypothetical protein
MGDIATLDAGMTSKGGTAPRGNPQHLRALEHANRVRLARARLKRKIGAGELPAAEVILSCPWEAHSMSISDVLMSQKRWGQTRCRRLLLSIGVPENKQVGTLTDRQRLALAGMLRKMAAATGRRMEPAGALSLA